MLTWWTQRMCWFHDNELVNFWCFGRANWNVRTQAIIACKIVKTTVLVRLWPLALGPIVKTESAVCFFCWLPHFIIGPHLVCSLVIVSVWIGDHAPRWTALVIFGDWVGKYVTQFWCFGFRFLLVFNRLCIPTNYVSYQWWETVLSMNEQVSVKQLGPSVTRVSLELPLAMMFQWMTIDAVGINISGIVPLSVPFLCELVCALLLVVQSRLERYQRSWKSRVFSG